MDDYTRKEIKKRQLIRLNNRDKIMLFLHHNLPIIFKLSKFNSCKCLNWHKKNKMVRMYNDGIYKIEKDLNLVRLVKMLKRINILMKNSLMTSKIDFEIAHQPDNIIDLDVDDNEEYQEHLSQEIHSSFEDTDSDTIL